MKIKKVKKKKTIIEKKEKELGGQLNPKRKFIRPSVLNLKNKVYITQEAYDLLRSAKRYLEKSMAQIVCDLIIKEFKK